MSFFLIILTPSKATSVALVINNTLCRHRRFVPRIVCCAYLIWILSGFVSPNAFHRGSFPVILGIGDHFWGSIRMWTLVMSLSRIYTGFEVIMCRKYHLNQFIIIKSLHNPGHSSSKNLSEIRFWYYLPS